LIAEERVGVQLVVGRSVLELDLVQSHLELFRMSMGIDVYAPCPIST